MVFFVLEIRRYRSTSSGSRNLLWDNSCSITPTLFQQSTCIVSPLNNEMEEAQLTWFRPCWVCDSVWGCEGSSCPTWVPWAKLACPGKVNWFGNSLANCSRVDKENGASPGIWACCCGCRIPEKGGIHELNGPWEDTKERKHFCFISKIIEDQSWAGKRQM